MSRRRGDPVRPRARARRLLLQALYQQQFTHDDAGTLDEQFLADGLGDADVAYFREVLPAVLDAVESVEAGLEPLLDRPLAQLDPVERGVLRLAGYELMHRLDLPYRVVIHEAVELAKEYGAEQSHKFINGVLDRFCGTIELRQAEREAREARR